MTYDKLIETISEIVNNELIYKKGLILEYKLNKDEHKKLNEHFYYKTKANETTDFEYMDEFEVNVGGVEVRFLKDE